MRLGTKQLASMMADICMQRPSLSENLLFWAATSAPTTKRPALKNWKMVCFVMRTDWYSVSVSFLSFFVVMIRVSIMMELKTSTTTELLIVSTV